MFRRMVLKSTLRLIHHDTENLRRGPADPDVLWEARGGGFTVPFRRESFLLRIFAAGLRGLATYSRLGHKDVSPGGMLRS